ncbi:hypothetical protein HMI01_14680 [Halolactibacillus miurensis]|uniref:Repressor LexA n=1 Tax=Halolactibacillus miurensis TaxID=306541 RepID=A0A1I6S271_9BACI|nr:S24 family peptidase [Halolactibacillus miurensis]GEM04480.1 hypothetical protein HMI01_14680 [Halolactibacillus miurensis]SFS71016.1 repressor LexA [Halolactibacillus miurensis]
MGKGKRLEDMILRSRYKNISQFSKAAGVPYTTIKSFIDRDLERASIDSVLKVANTLGVKIEDLVEEGNKVAEKKSAYTISSQYNYLPTSISAGLPLTVDGIDHAEKISVPDSIMGKWAGDSDIYMMRINGESMNKIIPHGSIIAIKPTDCNLLKDGDIVVYSDNHDYSVKKYFRDDNRIIFRPDSHDKRFYDYVTSDNNENLVIHGKVVVYIVELD